jgi:hypothetical protein
MADEQFVIRSLDGGLDGYLLKDLHEVLAQPTPRPAAA